MRRKRVRRKGRGEGRGGLLVVGCSFGQGEALHFQLQHLAVDLVQGQGLGGDLHLQLGCRFIYEVDRLHGIDVSVLIQQMPRGLLLLTWN